MCFWCWLLTKYYKLYLNDVILTSYLVSLLIVMQHTNMNEFFHFYLMNKVEKGEI